MRLSHHNEGKVYWCFVELITALYKETVRKSTEKLFTSKNLCMMSCYEFWMTWYRTITIWLQNHSPVAFSLSTGKDCLGMCTFLKDSFPVIGLNWWEKLFFENIFVCLRWVETGMWVAFYVHPKCSNYGNLLAHYKCTWKQVKSSSMQVEYK